MTNHILRKDRNCFGGGVLVYISETLKVKRRDDLNFIIKLSITTKSHLSEITSFCSNLPKKLR
jgi:hypothetical protein